MTQLTGFELLKEKVPEFGTPWKCVVIFIFWFFLFFLCMLFFLWFDSLVWYGPLISQLIIASICSVFSYGHMKNAKKYREKYGQLAYRYFFFHFIMPIFITYYSCVFHPLLVGGDLILPYWLAIIIGAFLFLFRPLTAIHIKHSGFDNVGHGLGIYTVFPEEGTVVSSKIYSFIRHPIYLGSFCAALGFGFIRNNLIAIFTALIFLIPIYIETRLEDKELIKRFGEEHINYIKNTSALFPRKKIIKFLKFLFFLERE